MSDVGAPLPFVCAAVKQLSGAHADGRSDAAPRALDVACGKGRHLAVLAAAGWSVSGVDRDAAALRLAAEGTPEAMLVAHDVEAHGLPAEVGTGFDLVLTTFFLYRPLVPAIAAVLAPGGRWLLETFHVENVRRRGRPRREHFALSPGEAAALAVEAGLVVEQVDEAERGEVFTTRLLARRPSDTV